jgi:hypothetical protein
MLRAVLVGLLAVSATSSCSDRGDTPKVVPGATAGRVLEASGGVVATRDGASRALAVGAEVFADDVIDTASGAVLILLHHNHARWAVESGQRTRVDESLAWKLARQERPAQAVDHASSAAGREGERAAADTRATSDQAEPASAAGAAAPESAPAAPPTPITPPPPPPPPIEPRAAEERMRGGGPAGAIAAPKSAGKRGPAAGAPPTANEERALQDEASAPDARPRAALAPTPEARLRNELEARRAELRRCLDGKLQLTLVVRVAQGAPAIELTGGAASAQVRACLARVVKQIPLAGVTASASIALTR